MGTLLKVFIAILAMVFLIGYLIGVMLKLLLLFAALLIAVVGIGYTLGYIFRV